MPCPFKLLGYDHLKVAVADQKSFERHLSSFGFTNFVEAFPEKKIPTHLKNPASVWGSGEAVIAIYSPDHPEAKHHYQKHLDTCFDLAFLVETPSYSNHPMIYEGVGGMKHSLFHKASFEVFPSKFGVLKFDHATMNVEAGRLDQTVENYIEAFGLVKGQYFNIRGEQTGLHSRVTRAPNLSVQMPFNEPTEAKSQIQEFINLHRGAGLQHLALETKNIIKTMDEVSLAQNKIRFLDIPDTYYELQKSRVKIRESFKDLERLRILIDQDTSGYLLQIFSENLLGPFFMELIQREGNQGFGEGNFGALFESMELDQKRRGVL